MEYVGGCVEEVDLLHMDQANHVAPLTHNTENCQHRAKFAKF